MQYFYTTTQGKAVLNKGDNAKLVTLGKYKTETEAMAACKAHYAKACKALENLGKPIPTAFYM